MNDEATPLVSVVIPTYNHGRYLGRALQSVLDQTFTNWEAIVIDNHSTDNTDEVMKNFAYPNIKYIKIHNNGVIAASRNAGIYAAKGDWIAFLDSDDWWTSDKLEKCMNFTGGNTDLIYHDLKIVSDKPKLFRNKKIKSRQVNKPVLTDLLVRGNAIATSSVVVRSRLLKLIGGMNERAEMIAAEDYNTWLQIACLTDNFKYIRECLGFYQLHNKGISSQKNMSIPTIIATKDFIEILTPLERRKYISIINYSRARYFYLNKNPCMAKKNLLLVIKICRNQLLAKSVWMLLNIYFKMIYRKYIKTKKV